MNTCQSCLYWKRFTDKYVLKYKGNGGFCRSKKFVYTSGKVPADGLALWDEEDVNADFATGESFGCIHWEKKQ